MDIFDAIEKRHAIKHFDLQHQMIPEEINKILSLAVLSPPSYNIQSWRFVNVVDEELCKKNRMASQGKIPPDTGKMLQRGQITLSQQLSSLTVTRNSLCVMSQYARAKLPLKL